MPEGQKGRLLTGARARLSLDGVKIGYARNVNITEEIEYSPVEVLDNIEVEDHEPIAYRVTFTASKFRVVGETLKSLNWMPSGGTNADERLSNILIRGAMSATLEDTRTTQIVATLEGVKIASNNWTVDARGIVGEDVTFVAIRVKDESEI